MGQKLDIEISNEGSIYLFRPVTQPALDWIDEHVDPDATWFAGSLVVEHRYAHDLAGGMAADGLELCR